MFLSAGVVGLAAGLDAVAGEPPARVHPVALFGRLVGLLDREWTRPRLVGLAGVVVLPAVAALAAGASVAVTWRLRPMAGVGLAAVVLFATTSYRLLLTTARSVSAATVGDLPAARAEVRALVGRDASDLTAPQVRSAVLESAAENLADGLVAPLSAFALGTVLGLSAVAPPTSAAVAAGIACAAWVKAINTMDSMLGYRSVPVGWAPARADDLVMWLPARLTALSLAVVDGSPRALARARHWTDAVRSPNSGWPMGVLAASLDVRLAKPGAYVLNGATDPPTPEATRRGIRHVAVTGALAYVVTAATVLIAEGMVA